LHPDRVGRVVIDGVVDPTDHYSGGWLTNLQDSDKIITSFCDYCFQAGPEGCSLYTGDSALDIETRLEQIISNLKVNPISVPASGTHGPEVVTFGDLYLRMLNAVYFSYPYTEPLFETLARVESGNATSIAIEKQ